MSEIVIDDLRAEVLAKVNAALVALGWQPLPALPAGVPGSLTGCVIARTFKQQLPMPVAVEGEHIHIATDGEAESIAAAWQTEVGEPQHFYLANIFGDRDVYPVGLPSSLVCFIARFDDKYYPDLIIRKGDEETSVVGGSEALLGGGTGGGSGGAPALLGGSESGGGAVQPSLTSS